MIQNLNKDDFTNKNYQKTLLNKWNELYELVLNEEFVDAYDKLLHDIKPKLTGLKEDENGNIYSNGVFNNSWIDNPELQTEFAEMTDVLMSSLSGLLLF